MKKILLNLALFQIGWVVCVVGGNIYAVAFTLLALLLHSWLVLTGPFEWFLFATTFMHALFWMHRYLWMAALMAAVLGPASYWIGTNLADASLALPLWSSLGIMAAGWALLFPCGLYYAGRLKA
jgi:uncharacterized membrane protein YGL010W